MKMFEVDTYNEISVSCIKLELFNWIEEEKQNIIFLKQSQVMIKFAFTSKNPK